MYPENNPQIDPGACGDGLGALPECAPLAVPYVPFQPNNPKRYSQQEALANGTLFPGLNLPFHIKAEAVKMLGTQLAELQALEFMLQELGLYLDTHQDDAEAFQLFRKYAALEAEVAGAMEAGENDPVGVIAETEVTSTQADQPSSAKEEVISGEAAVPAEELSEAPESEAEEIPADSADEREKEGTHGGDHH